MKKSHDMFISGVLITAVLLTAAALDSASAGGTTGPTITTVAGNGIAGYRGDGGTATSAELDSPQSVALDRTGNLYIIDTNNGRIVKVDASGILTTIAGDGTYGYNGDNITATAAKLALPLGVALDSSGNLYIGDSLNHRIRKVH